MTAWLGWRLAARRRAIGWVSLLAVFCVCAASGLVWLVDTSSRPTQEQFLSERVGTGSTRIVPHRTTGTSEEVARIDGALRETGVVAELGFSDREGVVKVGGVSHRVLVEGRSWTSGAFAATARVVDGRAPVGLGELAITPALATALGVGPGDTVEYRGTQALVVGVLVTPMRGGSAHVAFVDSGHAASAPTPGVFWVTAGPGPDPGTAQRLDVNVEPREAIRAPRSSLSTHPFLLGGSALAAAALSLGCVRTVVARRTDRSARALALVGASRAQLAAATLVECAVPAVAGTIAAATVVGLAATVVPPVVAASKQIETPPLNVPLGPTLALVASAVVLPALGGLMALVPAPAFLARRRPVRTGSVGGPVALGRRVLRQRMGRTSAVLGGVLLLALLPALLGSWVASASARAQDQALSRSSWRPGTVTLVLRGVEPPPALQRDLEREVGGPSGVVLELRLDGGVLYFAPTRPAETSCAPTLVVADAAGWRAVTGRDWTPQEQTDLHTRALGLHPDCVGTLAGTTGQGATGLGLTTSPASPEGDRHALLLAGVVMSTDVAHDLGLSVRPALLTAQAPRAITDDLRAAVASLVESHGFAATDLRYGVDPAPTTPLIVWAVLAETLSLIAVVVVCVAAATAMDDAPLHNTVHHLGAGLRQRATIHLMVAWLPVAAGAVVGTCAGILITQGIRGPHPDGWPPWVLLPAAIGALAAIPTLLTTPRVDPAAR